MDVSLNYVFQFNKLPVGCVEVDAVVGEPAVVIVVCVVEVGDTIDVVIDADDA